MSKHPELVHTYIAVVKIKGHKTDSQWRIVNSGRDISKLKLHLAKEMRAQALEIKYFKLDGLEGTVGRYFLT